VVVILIGVVALVVYALTGTPASPGVIHRARASNEVVASLSTVPGAVFDSVGVKAGSPLVPPTMLNHQPPLVSAGKPEVLFIGAEFCPFCAAERWPLIVALSRFGRFSALNNMQSAQASVFPGVQTFTFVGARYSSRYVSFTGIELYSDSAATDGAFTKIASLTAPQQAVLNRYATGTDSGSFPFVDIDNLMVASTSGFSPAVIEGRSQGSIASALGQAGDPVGQAIVASANYLTAGICRSTDQQPGPVCSSSGVLAATRSLGSA
jgi:thiol-disulfide isomerase/thioredoxin